MTVQTTEKKCSRAVVLYYIWIELVARVARFRMKQRGMAWHGMWGRGTEDWGLGDLGSALPTIYHVDVWQGRVCGWDCGFAFCAKCAVVNVSTVNLGFCRGVLLDPRLGCRVPPAYSLACLPSRPLFFLVIRTFFVYSFTTVERGAFQFRTSTVSLE